MPQSHCATFVHLVFSTKGRSPFLEDAGMRDRMFGFLSRTSTSLGCPALLVGGMPDHVHLLAKLGTSIAQKDWVKELKRNSSLWIKEQERNMSDFYWQAGYGVFSVSASNLGKVREYIANQQAHHQRLSFQDEFRALLRRHGLEWDERYVWD